MESPFLATLVRRLHLVIRDRVHADLEAAGHTELTIAHMYVFETPGPEGCGRRSWRPARTPRSKR